MIPTNAVLITATVSALGLVADLFISGAAVAAVCITALLSVFMLYNGYEVKMHKLNAMTTEEMEEIINDMNEELRRIIGDSDE